MRLKFSTLDSETTLDISQTKTTSTEEMVNNQTKPITGSEATLDVSQTQATSTKETVSVASVSSVLSDSSETSVPPLNDNALNSDQSAIMRNQMQDQSFMNYLNRLIGMISSPKNKRRFQKQVIDQVNKEIDNDQLR